MTGYVADLSWKSGALAIEKLDRLRSTMAVNVLKKAVYMLRSTHENDFDFGSDFVKEILTVRLLWPLTHIFQLKIHGAEMQFYIMHAS